MISNWNLDDQKSNPTIAKSLGAYMDVSALLTSIDLRANKLGAERAPSTLLRAS